MTSQMAAPGPLEGSTVLIVGASGAGTGAETAVAAEAAGASLILAARTPDGLGSVQRRLKRPARHVPLDMLDHATTAAAIAQIDAIDHVAITADPGRPGPFLTQPLEDAHAKMGKFWGQFHIARAAAPRLRAGGSMVLGSSIASTRPSASGAILTAVNAAIDGLTIALARELAPIRVNAVAPSWMIHEASPRSEAEQAEPWGREHLPVGHVGHPRNVAAVIVALMANPDITGVIVPIDGGLHVVS